MCVCVCYLEREGLQGKKEKTPTLVPMTITDSELFDLLRKGMHMIMHINMWEFRVEG